MQSFFVYRVSIASLAFLGLSTISAIEFPLAGTLTTPASLVAQCLPTAGLEISALATATTVILPTEDQSALPTGGEMLNIRDIPFTPTTPPVTPANPTSVIWYETTLSDGTTSWYPSTYIQTFAAVPDQWASPGSGSIFSSVGSNYTKTSNANGGARYNSLCLLLGRSVLEIFYAVIFALAICLLSVE